MNANKVVLNGETLIDLTTDTASEADVLSGKTFHKANGEIGVGTRKHSVFQEKAITSDGVYTPDEGYDGFSRVTVSVKSSIKTYSGEYLRL